MKKIVLLSLALFSVAALRADGPVDWAQYGRYELQNAVLDRPVEVVFMGNSITDSWIRVIPISSNGTGSSTAVSAGRRPSRCSPVSAAT